MEEKIKNAEFSPERQVHVLQHFTMIPDHYLRTIAGETGFSPADIKLKLNAPGSKFLPRFSSDPLHLLHVLKKNISYVTTQRTRGAEVMEVVYDFTLSSDHDLKMVGFENLIHINQLDAHEKKMVTTILRSNFEVKALETDKTVETTLVNLIISVHPTPGVITIFPGTYAPPFPNKALHNAEELNEYTDFWNDHVFLMKKRSN